jgi:hypothetical protein
VDESEMPAPDDDDDELLVLPAGSRSLRRESESEGADADACASRVSRTATTCTAGMDETSAVWPAVWEPIGHLGVAL